MTDDEPMSKRERQRANRLARQGRDAAASRRRRVVDVARWTAVAAIGVGAVMIILNAVGNSDPTGVPDAVVQVEIGEATHVDGDVEYATTPGAGGPHAPIWQNCGFYDEPVSEENAVHSLEHGAVWLTYRTDLDPSSLEALRGRAGGYVLVSPIEEQPAPIVATAWGAQLQLDSESDGRLDAFVRRFEQGPQTPEPGAVCSRGAGEPT